MKRKIRVAFYKNSKTKFGWLIRWKQEKNLESRYARYSHVELVFEDWQSFSSSEVDNGVRFKDIKHKKYNWDFIDIEVSEVKYAKILMWCEWQTWNKYNWWWIFFAQTLNFKRKGMWTWFCSEICTRALQEAWFLAPECALFTNPWELAEALERKYWYKIKEF